MPFSPNIGDRELACFAFVQDLTVKNVRPVLPVGDSLPISIIIDGDSTILFNDVSSVASGAVTQVITYTVPVGKIFSLNNVQASGSNVAKFDLKLNGNVVSVKRSWWTQFNVTFSFGLFELIAGDILTVEVIHNRPTSGDFECSIVGSLK